MNDYMNYLGGINAIQNQPVDPGTNNSGPTFWQNLMAAGNRAGGAGGGLAGLAAALNPQYAAGINQPMRNIPINSSMNGSAGMGGNSATQGNAQAAQASSGGLKNLAGAMGGGMSL